MRKCKNERPMWRFLKVTVFIAAKVCYVWSLPVMWQRWWSHHSNHHSQKPHATCKPDGSIFYRTGVMSDESLHCWKRYFGRFQLLCPWSLYTNFTCIGWTNMYKYELPASRLSKVIIWQTDNRRKDRIDVPCHFVGAQLWYLVFKTDY